MFNSRDHKGSLSAALASPCESVSGTIALPWRMRMVLDLCVCLFALVALVGACLALVEYARARRLKRSGGVSAPVAVVLAGTEEHPLSSVLVRSVAVSGVGDPTILCAAHPLRDQASENALREAFGFMASSCVHVRVGDPPSRVFPETWLETQAAHLVPDGVDVVVAVDASARPAAREVPPIAATVAGCRCMDAAGALPVAAPGSGGLLGSFWGRVVADLAPILHAWHGPVGLIPVCVAIHREAMSSALQDPLTLNRPGIAASTLLSIPRSRAVLLPLSVGILASGRGRTLSAVLARHLVVLARLAPARTLLLSIGIAALPMSLLAMVFSGTLLSMTAFTLAMAARVLLVATWTRAVQRSASALASCLLAPVRDLVILWLLVKAAVRTTVVSEGRLFRVRQGGILVPTGWETGE